MRIVRRLFAGPTLQRRRDFFQDQIGDAIGAGARELRTLFAEQLREIRFEHCESPQRGADAALVLPPLQQRVESSGADCRGREMEAIERGPEEQPEPQRIASMRLVEFRESLGGLR